jgi:chromosome segregation ATPase
MVPLLEKSERSKAETDAWLQKIEGTVGALLRQAGEWESDLKSVTREFKAQGDSVQGKVQDSINRSAEAVRKLESDLGGLVEAKSRSLEERFGTLRKELSAEGVELKEMVQGIARSVEQKAEINLEETSLKADSMIAKVNENIGQTNDQLKKIASRLAAYLTERTRRLEESLAAFKGEQATLLQQINKSYEHMREVYKIQLATIHDIEGSVESKQKQLEERTEAVAKSVEQIQQTLNEEARSSKDSVVKLQEEVNSLQKGIGKVNRLTDELRNDTASLKHESQENRTNYKRLLILLLALACALLVGMVLPAILRHF